MADANGMKFGVCREGLAQLNTAACDGSWLMPKSKGERLAMQNRVVMLADFDYFFAQCEELRNPAIKDKPVVVGRLLRTH